MPVVETKPAGPIAATPGAPEADPAAIVQTLSLVEIAERLERVTALIEAERTREREARARYQEIAAQADARIRAIKDEAGTLVREQQRRLRTFDGMLGESDPPQHDSPTSHRGRRNSPLATPANIGEAILRIWTLPEFDQPLTTDEISEALPAVGYQSKAAPRSMRSAVNQALARLCRDGRIDKYRQDGSIISHSDRRSRARKYMARP